MTLHSTHSNSARTEYEAWHAHLGVDELADAPWHGLVKRHLNAQKDLLNKRVLEIGCGRGGFACWLASQTDRPATIIAADFAASAVEKGRRHAAEHGLSGIQWEVSSILTIPHPDASFDTVISCETIEHVTDPKLALRELARVLKPGGRLHLTTPNYMGIMGLHRLYLAARGRPFSEVGQPINHCLLLPITMAWVKTAGLRIKAIDGIGHYVPFPGRPPIEKPIFNEPRVLMRWFGLHSILVAEKP